MDGRILIVDDDWFVRQVYADGLAREGFDVVCAADGAEALDLLGRESFDVIVTDILMPEMDGLELLDRVKRGWPGIEVVVLTGVESVDTAVRAMRAGAWHYLVKPVSAEALALDLSRCLERRRLVREHEVLKRYAELFEVSQRIAACLDVDRLHPLALDALRSATGAEAALLCRTTDDGTLELAARRGLDAEQASWLSKTLHGHAPAAFTAAEPTRIPALHTLIPGRDPRVRRLHEALVVPLLESSGNLGAVVLCAGKGGLPESATRDAKFLSRCVAQALHNAERYVEARELALVDALTGLHNHGALELALSRTLEQRRGHRQPFSLLFLDMDHLKAVNDKHGHQTGGAVIAEVGRLLARQTRQEDLLVRYGGDEFVALLRDADRAAALAVAERMRRAVESHRFLAREGFDMKLTVCVGVATWPDDAEDGPTLLHRADLAMYAGKRLHRNSVRSYDEIG